jgi:3-oxoacyl-[acyl-carrier protein] reductase
VSPRNVVVTGGSRGLGASIVQSLLDRGDHVATCSRAPSGSIKSWASDPQTSERFLYEQIDIADRTDCDRFVAATANRFGAIDVLVNNAGVARDGVLGLFSDEDVDTVVDLNLKGTFQMTKLVLRRMLRRGSGRIVNISSIVGVSGYRGLSVYGATKAGLDGFTRALAREVGSRGITVNSVAPGYLRTEMSHGMSETQLNQVVRRTPAGRLGEGEDVAAAVQFLVSEQAGFITGQVLVVDGGLTA